MKKVVKPRVSAFGGGGGGSSSEESDNESRFMANVLKKRRKIGQEMESTDASALKDEINELDKEKAAVDPVRKSKYIGKILEAKRKREEDQLESRMRAEEKNRVGEVFESEAYRAQKEKVLLRTEEAEEQENKGNFYGHLLDRRTGVDTEIERKNVQDGRETEKETEREDDNRIDEKTGKTRYNRNIGRGTYVDSTDSQSQLIQRLKQYCKSKLTEQQLQDYKEKYRQRHKLT